MQQVRERVLALAGRIIAGYRLERVLAGGAAEVMYLGRLAEKRNEPIARPGLPPLVLPDQALVDLLPVQEHRAERAARLQKLRPKLQRLSHPSILPLLGCGDDPTSGCIFTIYPYPNAGSLEEQLSAAKGQPLPLADVTKILIEIASALDTGHKQGYFHLHLSPSTIRLDASGIACLANIGVAQTLELGYAIAEGSLYAAPEQIIHDPIGPTTDVYSLGMVIYQLVTGHTAFDSTRYQLQSPPPPTNYRPDLPAEIETVIMRAISSYPTQRYATPGFFAHDFALAVDKADLQPSDRGIKSEAPAVTVTAAAPASPPQPKAKAKAKAKDRAKAPAGQSFVVASPPATGNTLYPPTPQPQWELPSDLANQLAETPQTLELPAPSAKRGSRKTKRRTSARGIAVVSFLIAVVSLAILAILIFPVLNHPVSLPFLSSPGRGSSVTAVPTSISALTGATLYRTSTPGACDKGGASWAQNSESEESCSATATLLSALNCQNCPLAVVTLGSLPNKAAYPSNYTVHVTVQPLATNSSVMFGLKFRQQSLQDVGNGRGGYSYLVSQNGQWEFDRYAADGTRQTLASGKLRSALPPNATLGLVVNGSTFAFYVNSELIATEHDATYQSGYLCLVAQPSSTVLFSRFWLAKVA
jgi:serine/threonine-protein kinase